MGGKRCEPINLGYLYTYLSLRNAAKARSRDTTGRVQKGFFGRQRLDMLSKGLSANQERTQNLKHVRENPVSDIGLAHARPKSSVAMNEDISLDGFIPAPIHISPCTPKSKARKSKYLSDSASSSSSCPPRSEVLNALDTSERRCLPHQGCSFRFNIPLSNSDVHASRHRPNPLHPGLGRSPKARGAMHST